MLRELEHKLSTLSHSEEAIREVRTFCSGLSNTQARLDIWTADEALLRKPIEREGLRELGSILLPVHTIRRTDLDANRTIGELAKFSRKDSMYIPPLEDDDEGVAGNAIRFDGVCQISTVDLHVANRVASLSIVGWRIFGAFSRSVFTRANPREIEMRRAVEQSSAAA
jgi:hypothetical protein